MKLDSDPGRTRELGVFWLLMLVLLAAASASDFLLAPNQTTLAEAWEPPDSSQQAGVLIDPWIPQAP
jgi:hypothetical protein